MSMRVLVIGKNGQVAQALARLNGVPGANIICVGRPDFDLGASDLATARWLLEKHQPDIVINAGAYTAVDRAENEPELAFAINASGAGVAAKAAALAGLPFIHLSTDYVFDGTKTSAYAEADETNPLSIYGKSKRQGEMLVAAANPRHVILRTSWIYSPYTSNFAKTILRVARERRKVTVVDDQIGAPTSAALLAKTLLEVASNIFTHPEDMALYGYFHAACAGETSWHGFAREILTTSRDFSEPAPKLEAVSTAAFGAKAQRPLNSRLDCEKLRHVHGISLPHWRDPVALVVREIIRENNAL